MGSSRILAHTVDPVLAGDRDELVHANDDEDQAVTNKEHKSRH